MVPMKLNRLWIPILLILAAGACFTSYTRQYIRTEVVADSEITAYSEAAAYSNMVTDSETAAEPEVYTRLRELDEQIAENHAKDTEASANARKAAAETERRLWQAELDRMLTVLEEELPKEEWNRLAVEQSQWFLTREDHVGEASENRSSSTLREIDHQISLTESTRDRVYKLAEEYQEILSATEE